MLFSELNDAIVTNTARPDLVAETIQHIQAATLHYHVLDFWKKDLKEQVIAVVTDPISFKFPITLATLTRHRKIKYVRKWDAPTSTPGAYFKRIDSANLLDNYNVAFPNRFYLAGQSYQFYSNSADLNVMAGWYQFPVIAPVVNYASWIADEWPYAIIDKATATLLSLIGKVEEAKRFELACSNPIDPFNPGWIQKIFKDNLVEGSESTA